VSTVDWIAAAVIGLAALNGLRRGLVGGALSLAGILAGAYFGAKLAPEFLPGSESAYTPLVALAGAVALGFFLQSLAAMAGNAIRSSLFVLPPLRVLDSVGGFLLGAAAGAAIVWVAGAVALHIPGQVQLREEVQSSRILGELNARVPPSRLLDAIARVDPFSAILGPVPRVAPPDPALLNSPGVRLASPSVFRIIGTACGLGIEGSGWVAAPNLIVTNAHVVAGMKDARVDRNDGESRDATVVAFDPRNDIAVLRVAGLGAPPLRLVDPVKGQAVAILGYPENGPFTATAGRIGQTGEVFTDDAYGRPFRRLVTTLRGLVRHGNSGGPAVDGQGRVQTTIFASRIGSPAGYGVPSDLVRRELTRVSATEVSSGPCVG
jgi:S1-C subfamily serine protease